MPTSATTPEDETASPNLPPDPVFGDPGDSPVPAPELDDPELEDEPEPAAPPEPPQESREAQLSRENAEYRSLLTQMQVQMSQRDTRPAPSVIDDPLTPLLQGIPPQQQEQWRESFRVLNPAIQHQVQRMLEPLQRQLQQTELQVRQNATVAESMALAQKYPQYGQHAQAIETARWQEYQRTNIWHPLELVYSVVLGHQQMQQPAAAQRQRQTERRKNQGRAAAPTTAENHGTRMPAPRRTVEQTLAMSDDQILNLAETNGGIERMRLPTRKRA